jgi:hypothetical protein
MDPTEIRGRSRKNICFRALGHCSAENRYENVSTKKYEWIGHVILYYHANFYVQQKLVSDVKKSEISTSIVTG